MLPQLGAVQPPGERALGPPHKATDKQWLNQGEDLGPDSQPPSPSLLRVSSTGPRELAGLTHPTSPEQGPWGDSEGRSQSGSPSPHDHGQTTRPPYVPPALATP